MAHANYTVSTHTSIEDQGDSVGAGTIVSSVVLVITPNTGFVVTAANFHIGDPLPSEVQNVVFSDTTTAGQPGNLVHVTVTFDHFIMPGTDKDIIIDIDGEAQRRVNTSQDIAVCMMDTVSKEGFCDEDNPVTSWPGAGNPAYPAGGGGPDTGASSINPICLSQFINTDDGNGISSLMTANSAWINPTHGMIDNGLVTTHSGNVPPNTQTVLFTKTFWTAPGQSYNTTPFYVLSAAALASGYYTVEETPDVYDVDKTLTASVSNSNIITCDTTDIIPGMQVTGTTLLSCGDHTGSIAQQGAGGCYPWGWEDVRVMSVDYSAGTVALTEKIVSLSNGDILNFSSTMQIHQNQIDSQSSVPYPGNIYLVASSAVETCCKKFTIKFNGPTAVSCEDDHEISFGTDVGPANWVTGAASPKIMQVNLDTANLSNKGESRTLTVVGNRPDVKFTLRIDDESNNTYDFETEAFTKTPTVLANQTVDSDGFYRTSINFPSSNTDKTYVTEIIPYSVVENENVDTTTTFDTSVESTYENKSYPTKTLTFAAAGEGLTFDGSTLTAPGTLQYEGGKIINTRTPSWTGTVAKGGAKIYSPPYLQNATPDDDGSFTNAVANDGEMNLNISFSASGSDTITASVTGDVIKMPTANTTVTLQVTDFVSTTPNCYDSIVNYSMSAGIAIIQVHRTSIDPSSGAQVNGIPYDYDANFDITAPLMSGRKGFFVVDASGLNHGTIGADHSDGSYDDGYFYSNASGGASGSTEVDQIVYKGDGSGVLGTVETFTYNCRDNANTSATKTCTITYVE